MEIVNSILIPVEGIRIVIEFIHNLLTEHGSMLQSVILTDLERIDNDLWQQYTRLTQEIGQTWQNGIYDPEGVSTRHMDKWDAFYGDPGMIPRQCVLKGIPVMMQNLETLME